MAQKAKKWEEYLFLSGESSKVVSYVDYFLRRPLFLRLQLKNTADRAAENITVTVKNANGMLIENEKLFAEIPFESVVDISPDNLLSPVYFSSLEEIKEEQITVTVKKDKKTVAQQTFTLTALPFDFWSGYEGDNEQLACFVRPRLADCFKLQADVETQLKKWNAKAELGGYVGNDKNAIRHIVAAVYAAIRKLGITQTPANIAKPVSTSTVAKLLSAKEASSLELSLFVCSLLESLGLHPVLVFGEKEITCGVWLYDSCFLDSVSDDMERLGAYIADGINNLSCFDVQDLFADRNAAYATAEGHFIEKLQSGAYYDRCVDIHRCRISHVLPLPIRAKSVKGYELLSSSAAAPDSAPTMLTADKKWELDKKQTRDKQWERRLLDLSMKNALLHFTRKVAVQMLSRSADDTLDALLKSGELILGGITPTVKQTLAEASPFGLSSQIKPLSELIQMENNAGWLRSTLMDEELEERLSRLMRKNKEAYEESGTKILYLALGFLRWYTREDGAEHFAPLILQPVNLKKSKGGVGYTLVALEEEFAINTTLLEYLKQEFNIDMRGMENGLQGLKIAEVLAMVRREVVRMRGWEVFDDVYLSTFSFSRYQMWYDLRQNIAEFSKNEIVRALLDNSSIVGGESEGITEDEARPDTTLTPLSADASQWAAISLSQTGKSFVLHGPPGTGKSQTITNVIANALNDGKRVLFVAEKQAALSVVKKRLDALGLGDFCLELHSNKTNKSDVLQKLVHTLSLAGNSQKISLGEKSTSLYKWKQELAEPLIALHKKRRLGVSIYEALLVCLQNKNAPDIMHIESTFYDGLTKEKMDEYERMMIQAAAAAKECGGANNSPFENVNVTEYDLSLRDSVYCAAEVVVAEIKHLKNYVSLFLDLYRQKISTLTRTKLENLNEISKMLSGGLLGKYYRQDEEEFFAFFNANRRLDAAFAEHLARYKKWVNVSGAEYAALSDYCAQDKAHSAGADILQNKWIKGVIKRLKRLQISENVPTKDELLHSLETLYTAQEAMQQIRTHTDLSQYFTFAFGRVDYFGARKNFLKDLYALHALCESVFMDYNESSFNSMCIRAANGYSAPVLEGLTRSLSGFLSAEESLLAITKGEKSKIPEEDVLGYYIAKAGALIENIDMLAPWCMYKKTAQELNSRGLRFITDALENGSVTGENIVESFEKNVYKNFLQTNIPLDPVLSRFSATVFEEKAEAFRLGSDEFSKLSKEYILAKLISRLPTPQTEGALAVEQAAFTRLSKSHLRGMGLRKLFDEIPELIKVIAPCMLMSPITVSQYLQAKSGLFDLVIFDEASQIPTAEAVCSLARGKAAVIVGDPNQLPPTSFFQTNFTDEDNLENEDMESVLDDCLSINMPQRHLSWHYRSKHESLIAFSNTMYYENRLCTFPSPDALSSKVQFVLVEDGIYDRGVSKTNKAEGDALVAEVIRRLTDTTLQKSSIGVVTLSSVQKDYIERKLTAEIAQRRLESVAYDREEPLFVKNLENVQGDERDVVLFSLCYGPDRLGRVSLNFGPINQAGGWRRLNVAVSRAREEMVVFASMTSAMIDLSKTNSKGVAGLKAFLEFAEKGRTNLAISSRNLTANKVGIGKYIAEELSSYGYDCRYDVGVSGFKIDVAVVDPKNKHQFLLAILCDTPNSFSIKDRNVLQMQTLKRNNWNVLRLFSVNYYNNPKREIKKIKDVLDKLTGADKKGGTELNRAKKAYKAATLESLQETALYVTSGENDKEITARLKAIVAAEEPISYPFLLRRCTSSLGVYKYGSKVESHIQALIGLCGFKEQKIMGVTYYRKTDKCLAFDKYRVETGESLRRFETDYSPYDIVAIIRATLEDKVALYVSEINAIIASVLRMPRLAEKFAVYINECISYGEQIGLFVRSVSDRISLA